MLIHTIDPWPKWCWLVLLLSAAFLCMIGSWSWSIYILDEVKNASCAFEMADRNDWIVPTFNGALRTDKPPLHYFAMRIAYAIGGVTPFMARIFSGFIGIFTVFYTVWFVKKIIGNSMAWYTGIVLLASIHFCFEFHLAVPDPYLIAFVGVACLSFYYALHQQLVQYLWVAYIALALGALAKGPIAIVIPALSLFIHLLISGWSWKKVGFILNPWGILLFLSIALPWYFAVHFATAGAWTAGFFLEHNLDRFSDTMEGHGGPFFMPWLFIILGLLPFSVFLFTRPKIWKQITSDPFLRYCLIVALVIGGIFTISQTKLPNYTMPAYPFFAVLIAFALTKIKKAEMRLGIGIILSIFCACSLGAWIFLRNELLFHTVAWTAGMAFIPIIIAILYVILRWKKLDSNKIIHYIALGSAIVSILIFSWCYPAIDRQNPLAKAGSLIDGADHIVAYDQFNPAIVFHQKKPIPVMEDPASLLVYLKQFPEALIISRKKFADELAEYGIVLVYQGKDLFDKSITACYRLNK